MIRTKGRVIIYGGGGGGGGGGGVAPKRKGLGKQNFERAKGWLNEKQNNSRVTYYIMV
jgi:hypothetical protein